MTPSQRSALTWIALGQLFVLSLWFSASAVAPQLQTTWDLSDSQLPWLTLTVQIGFVVGALISSFANLADIIPSRRLFVGAAIVAAFVNAGLLAVDSDSVGFAFALRFVTGMLLAAVYPSGLKVMSGWFIKGRGMALGVLVGALTLGSASPHLVRGIGLDWEGVIIASSALALLGAALMAKVGDGPHEIPPQKFRIEQVASVVRNRGVRLSTYGYLGHMWELYAMWTWMAAFLTASSEASGLSYGSVPTLTFFIIGVGGLGAWYAGTLADRLGRTRVAGGSMVVSGACAVVSALVFGLSPWVVLPVMLIWGVTIVADSAQFSAMVTETADGETRGTALTLQTALGFLLTLVTIQGVPLIVDAVGWRWAFPFLALGPLVGTAAMVALYRSPEARALAGGRG